MLDIELSIWHALKLYYANKKVVEVQIPEFQGNEDAASKESRKTSWRKWCVNWDLVSEWISELNYRGRDIVPDVFYENYF